MSRLLLIVTGYGPPHVEQKREWLQKNVEQVKRTFTGTVFVKLFNYGAKPCGCELVDEEIMTPQPYDYVLCILDDIELSGEFDVNRALHNLRYYNLDIVQPALTPTSKHSHSFMLQDASAGVSVFECLYRCDRAGETTDTTGPYLLHNC